MSNARNLANLLGTSTTVPSSKQPAGSVLQVVSTTKTDVTSFASSNTNTFVDISGMSVSITPTSSSNKVLVIFSCNISQSTTATAHIRLVRGSTAISVGDSSGNRFGSTSVLRSQADPYNFEMGELSGMFLDSPATTSATTYKMQGTLGSTYNGTFYLNRTKNDTDADYGSRGVSSITVMEIAG